MKHNGRAAARRSRAYAETANQPASWQQTLDLADRLMPDLLRLAEAEPEAEVVFTGCGSSYLQGLAASGLFQEVTGRPARAVPASDLLLAPATVLVRGRRYIIFAMSRTGETSETVAAVRRTREAGHATVGCTTRLGTALTREAALALELPHADDRSLVATQSGTNMLLLTQLWAAALAGRADLRQELEELPAAAAAGQQAWEEAAAGLGEDLGRRAFVYLGSGSYYGVAAEAQLKMKEMSQEPAEAWHTLEFRHGPMSVITEQSMVVLVSTRRGARHEADLLADLARLGARTVAVGEGTGALRAGIAVELGSGLPDWTGAPLRLVPLQFLALYRAAALGKDPDRPPFLNEVVKLGGER